VVLLFDEADALFGARTDTHSSNDRFANQQTNYLLSRLERFDGIAVLTSNARQRLDGAFARRIDALVEFRQPGVEERRALWALHLGAAVPTPWLDRLASLVELPGGHVRAAALYAQALALDAGRALTPEDLLAGLQAEHAKLDRSVAPELLRPWR
jgi:SpoVK/Ycf46/Vps4 family AAA+-type ATPase